MIKLFKSNKGFTLSELLVVIAIIAILVVISIPVFAGQLESSSEETDIGNLRAAKSLGTAMSIEGKDLDGNIIDDKGVLYNFDASSGILTKEEPEGYGQGSESDGGCEDFELVVNPTDAIPQSKYTSTSDVVDAYIQVKITGNGTVSLSWKKDTSFKAPEGSKAYAMTQSNRNMIGYKNGFEPTSTFTYNGADYYFDSIESKAYYAYSGIVYIPASVTKIAIDAFDDATITGFKIEEGNKYFTTIENGKILTTADNKVLIRAITNYKGNGSGWRYTCSVPSGVEDIGHAFYKNKYITELVLPDTLTVLHPYALQTVRELSFLSIPGSVSSIPENLLSTTMTTTIRIKEGVKSIGSNAFSAYSIYAEVPDTVTNAGSDCFKYTKSNGSVTIKFLNTKYTTCSSFERAVSKNK